MGQIRHGIATTPHAVRAAIRRSQASLSALSRELGINPKTVAKWRKRKTVEYLKTVPYRIHTTLTDNGIQFADQPRNRNTAFSRQMRIDMIREANDIEHRLTTPNHPWTNGQAERMNRTIKDATVERVASGGVIRRYPSPGPRSVPFPRPADSSGGAGGRGRQLHIPRSVP